ncbi:DNA-directed DNA polymerase gamma mip1, partial [Coemansia brasiliensis]
MLYISNRGRRQLWQAACQCRPLICSWRQIQSSVAGERKNALDIVMLAERLRQGVFGKQRFPAATAEQQQISIEHLKSQGIYGKQGEPVDNTDFDPPPLLGENIEEHFEQMGNLAAQPYLQMTEQFAQTADSDIPPQPQATQWLMQSGWTRYARDGSTRR